MSHLVKAIISTGNIILYTKFCVLPRVSMRVQIKLQLSGTIYYQEYIIVLCTLDIMHTYIDPFILPVGRIGMDTTMASVIVNTIE